MFPEGTRCHGPVIEELFDGTAYVGARAGVPIVPLGHRRERGDDAEGRQDAPRRRSSCSWSATPIPPPERSEAGRVPRSAVGELTERLHEELQDLFDEAQSAGRRPTPRPTVGVAVAVAGSSAGR